MKNNLVLHLQRLGDENNQSRFARRLSQPTAACTFRSTVTSSASSEPPSNISANAARVWVRNLMHSRCWRRQCLGKTPSKRKSTPRRRRRNQANRRSIWPSCPCVDPCGNRGSYGCICWLQKDSICPVNDWLGEVYAKRRRCKEVLGVSALKFLMKDAPPNCEHNIRVAVMSFQCPFCHLLLARLAPEGINHQTSFVERSELPRLFGISLKALWVRR